MEIRNNTQNETLSIKVQSNISGGNLENAWLNEALKILIAYWGSIKTGFSDGYNDYWEHQK
jgi:hypothetical protein